MPHRPFHSAPEPYTPPVLPPGAVTGIDPYDAAALKEHEFQVWLDSIRAAGPNQFSLSDFAQAPTQQPLMVDPLPGADVSGYAWPPPPPGTPLTPDQARRLDDAGLLRDPDTGQPLYPLSPEAIQALNQPLSPFAEAGKELLGYAELAGEGLISMGADIFDPGSGVPGATTPRRLRELDVLEKFIEEHGRNPYPHEWAGISAKATPLPTLVRPLIYGVVDPLLAFGAASKVHKTFPLAKALVGGVATHKSPGVRKIINALAEADPIRQAQEASFKGERAERIEAFLKDLEAMEAIQGGPSEAAYAEAFRNLRGEFAKEEFGSVRSLLTDDEFQELFEIVRYHESSQEGYSLINNMNAFNALMFGPSVPQPAQLRRLESMFGTEMVNTIVGARRNDTWQNVMDVIGLPRAIVASFDLSAPLRQGRALGFNNPREFGGAFKSMFQVLSPRWGESMTVAVEESIRGHRLYNLAENSGLFFAERAGVKGTASAAEEAFVSRFASSIPGIKISERAYTTFLNKFRHDIFYKHAAEMQGHATAEDFKALARMINYGTGRGPLPRAMGNDLANMASATFFAPRFMTSQPSFVVRGIYDAARAKSFNRGVSRAFASNLVGFWTSGMGLLGIADLIGKRMRAEGISPMEAPSVEWDPRSSDFAKIKLGNTRLDMWGGYQPLIRYSAQFIGPGFAAGKKKQLNSGKIVDHPRWDTVLRWAQTKLSPAGAMGRDVVSGENFLGETMEFSWDTLRREAFSRFVPMVAQDLADAFNQANNPWEVLKAAPAVFGVGAQTFQTSADLKDRLSWDLHGKLFSDPGMLDADRDAINNSWEVREQQRKFDKAQAPRFSTPEKISVARGFYRDAKTRYGEELMAEVRAGAKGEVLRNAVQTYLSKKANGYDTVFSPELQDYIQSGKDDPEELFRDRYWGVEPRIYLGTKFVDYSGVEPERIEILKEAAAAGLNPDNITNRRSSGNGEVDTLLTQYRQDQEALKYWWDMERMYMEQFSEGPPGGKGDLLAAWMKYKQSDFDKYYVKYVSEGPNKIVGTHPQATLANLLELINNYKRAMRENHIPELKGISLTGAELERVLLRWGYIRPDQAKNETTIKQLSAELGQEMGAWDQPPVAAQ